MYLIIIISLSSRKRYSDPLNQEIVKSLILNSKGLDGSVLISQIQGSVN